MSDQLKGEKKAMRLHQVTTNVPYESHLCAQNGAVAGNPELDGIAAAGAGGIQTHPTHVAVLVEPHLGVLVSMAVCLDHGFGLLSPEHQESKLHDMRKLYDEVVGQGYYCPERDEFYQGFVTATTRAELSGESLGQRAPIGD